MNYFSQKKEEVINYFNSDITKGLSSQEVETRREKYGENKLNEKKKKSVFKKFLAQFSDLMIIILLIAACISFTLACISKEPMEFIEAGLIVLIVILNAVMGVIQEGKAEKALEALKNMSTPHARVLRDGNEIVVLTSELVPGDIIYLEAGDFVPADARLISSTNLKVEESALTGESIPSEKNSEAIIKEDAPIGDRENMVFQGCSITYGNAKAIVVAIGMQTEMGKIANLLENEKEIKTPLQQKLAHLGKILGLVALLACVIVFVVGLLEGKDLMLMFMTAVSLAVSAIPEGLPAIVTIVLSLGVSRMAKKNAIIKSLPAVETLGSASIICSDKTGTLTQNKMTIVKTYVEGKEDVSFNKENCDEETKRMITLATLCCDGSVNFTGEKEIHIGDPTETAIIVAAHKLGLEQKDLNDKYKRLGELPFDSDRKLMLSINNIDGVNYAIVKGAFDVMQNRFIKGDLEKAKIVNEKMSSESLRVLAIGYKIIKEVPDVLSSEELEHDLVFVGLLGMIDPPRPEAKMAVATCKKAGIKPIMITGDHVITASAIAREIGILGPNDIAITGSQLDAMSDEELDKNVQNIAVYARVSPENKIRIVKAWQRKGKVVSMTGDGVNDAPALKAADIGCAMGITGTDVAKGAADITLVDDNFATIVDAVKEGRGIYANIKKVVGYLLGTNISELIVVFLAVLVWKETPFAAVQLLWINLVTDSLPAIALGVEKVEDDVMNQAPKPKNESIFAHGFGLRIVLQGLMFSAIVLAAFFIGKAITGGSSIGGSTLAFMVFALVETFHAFNMRSDHSIFKIGLFSNKQMNWSALVSLLLVALVLFTPGVVTAFNMMYLPYYGYLIGLGLSLVPMIIMECSKAFGLIKHQK